MAITLQFTTHTVLIYNMLDFFFTVMGLYYSAVYNITGKEVTEIKQVSEVNGVYSVKI